MREKQQVHTAVGKFEMMDTKLRIETLTNGGTLGGGYVRAEVEHTRRFNNTRGETTTDLMMTGD